MDIVKFEPPTLLTIAVPFPELPTAMVPKPRLAGFRLICCGAAVAVPASATCSEETPASVATVRVPETLPGEFGSNQTWKLLVWPVVNESGRVRPVKENWLFDIFAWLMFTAMLPVFAIETF